MTPKSSPQYFVAIDLGATSGRVVVGSINADAGVPRLEQFVVHRFDNNIVRLPHANGDHLHWNILELWQQTLAGLSAAAAFATKMGGHVASIGVDSWAVDYGLLRGGALIASPRHYRDSRSQTGVAGVYKVVSRDELYEYNGLQHLPFNSVFQLACDATSGLLAAADTMLLIPDLFAYWLTGTARCELTNASTTGLIDPRTGTVAAGLISKLGFSPELLAPLIEPGETYGTLLPQIAREVGFAESVTVVAVGSHDTASAVAATPLRESGAAYISSGTWSLVGLELREPIITAAAREANFTNELGVDGTVRFLKNVSGLWLLSECLRAWDATGGHAGLEPLLRAAALCTDEVPVFDADDPTFIEPGDMPQRIAAWCLARGSSGPQSHAAMVKSILVSLAHAYQRALDVAAALTGKPVHVVHVVGGGSQNTLLCQLLADTVGLPVVAGPVEATALGNLAVQARAAGALGGGLADVRSLVLNSVEVKEYLPREPAPEPAT